MRFGRRAAPVATVCLLRGTEGFRQALQGNQKRLSIISVPQPYFGNNRRFHIGQFRHNRFKVRLTFTNLQGLAVNIARFGDEILVRNL